jgi:hypothetical protein
MAERHLKSCHQNDGSFLSQKFQNGIIPKPFFVLNSTSPIKNITISPSFHKKAHYFID